MVFFARGQPIPLTLTLESFGLGHSALVSVFRQMHRRRRRLRRGWGAASPRSCAVSARGEEEAPAAGGAEGWTPCVSRGAVLFGFGVGVPSVATDEISLAAFQMVGRTGLLPSVDFFNLCGTPVIFIILLDESMEAFM